MVVITSLNKNIALKPNLVTKIPGLAEDLGFSKNVFYGALWIGLFFG